MSSETRTNWIYLARLAEQSERYEGTAGSAFCSITL